MTYTVRCSATLTKPESQGNAVAVFKTFTEAEKFVFNDFQKNGKTTLYISEDFN